MLLGQNFGCIQRPHRHSAVADDSCVLARPFDIGHAERDDIVAFGHWPELAVGCLVLDKDYRIITADSGFEQALGVIGR